MWESFPDRPIAVLPDSALPGSPWTLSLPTQPSALGAISFVPFLVVPQLRWQGGLKLELQLLTATSELRP
jgi:hypothetical protein